MFEQIEVASNRVPCDVADGMIRGMLFVVPRRQIRCTVFPLLLGLGFTPAVEGQSLEPVDDLLVTCPSVPELVASNTGFEYIVNPVVSSRTEIEDRFNEFERIRDCLFQLPATSDRALPPARQPLPICAVICVVTP